MVVRGAERTGCGIVFLATSESSAPAIDEQLTEALVHGVAEDDAGFLSPDALEQILELARRASALAVGPGMGVGDGGRELLEGILREVDVPVLLDADALTNLAGTDVLAGRDAPTIVTPHAGELGSSARHRGRRRLGRPVALGPRGRRAFRLLRLAQGIGHAHRPGREGRRQLDREASRSPPRGRGTCFRV